MVSTSCPRPPPPPPPARPPPPPPARPPEPACPPPRPAPAESASLLTSLTNAAIPVPPPAGTVARSCSSVRTSPSARRNRKVGWGTWAGIRPDLRMASTIALTLRLITSGSRPGGAIRLHISHAGCPTISEAVCPVSLSTSRLHVVTMPCWSVRTAAVEPGRCETARRAFATLTPFLASTALPGIAIVHAGAGYSRRRSMALRKPPSSGRQARPSSHHRPDQVHAEYRPVDTRKYDCPG